MDDEQLKEMNVTDKLLRELKERLKRERDAAGRGEAGRHLAVCFTELEGVVLRYGQAKLELVFAHE